MLYVSDVRKHILPRKIHPWNTSMATKTSTVWLAIAIALVSQHGTNAVEDMPKTTPAAPPSDSPRSRDGIKSTAGTTRMVHDFEDPGKHGWTTVNKPYSSVFYRQRADQHFNELFHPRVDVTTGTSQGFYGYAFYDANATTNHYCSLYSSCQSPPLYSSCQSPSGSKCRLEFHAVIHAAGGLHVGTFLRCADCTVDLRAKKRYWVEHSVGSTTTLTYEKWQKHSIPLGYHPVTFDISITGLLGNRGEFVALDDIELVDCDPEPSQLEKVECPEETYQCMDTQTCLPLDKLCDQHPDCLCEDDELEETCEPIPPEGYLRLDTCSFDSGNCSWYDSDLNTAASADSSSLGRREHNQNTESHDSSGAKQRYGWEEAELAKPEDDYIYIRHGDKPPYAPTDGYLRVQMPPHSRADVAILRSLAFQPLFSGDGQCQVRFWHRNTASKEAILKLELVELRSHVTNKPVRELWLSSHLATTAAPTESNEMVDQVKTGAGQRSERMPDASAPLDGVEEWSRVVVDLNSVAVNFSYLLQFKVSSTDLKTRGEVSVRNISMSLGCFYGVLSFDACGLSGPSGPTQELCDKHYQQEKFVNVREDQKDPFRGAQSWMVPETMTYRVQALGSQGGEGVTRASDMRKTRGASVTAKFMLNEGDHLLFLVGQLGDSACEIRKGPEMLLPPFCPSSHASMSVKGGGGGGGGATVVYRVRGGDVAVLMVAGGGGGLPFISPDMVYVETSTVPYDLSTEGFEVLMTKSEADAFLEGSMTGREPCSQSVYNNVTWASSGGFGRGGGACVGGGYGGGADVSADHHDPDTVEVGRPGRSYTHESALYSTVVPDIHAGSGFVEIMSVSNCPCVYRCLWLGPLVDSPSCICQFGQRIDKDNKTCLDIPIAFVDDSQNHILIPLMIGASIVIVLIAISVCLYLKRHTFRSRHSASSMEKISYFLCPCLSFPRRPMGLSAHILPQLQHPPTVMRVNPNYDIVDAKPAEQGLLEIPRKNIKLTGELGQGAFGQVYSGLMSNVPRADGDMPVAVKTLPPVCTEQTESDFHMEAVIVSQFNHPNIVKFIGVCFNQHPHYIVLELLEGGDLKTFLRACRPKQDQPSSLTVLDLLRLSLDVACGCLHLEEKRFIHRDIAARNCLLTTKGPNRRAKIADFGMARDIYRSDYYKKVGRAMLPVKWMPPEAFLDGVFTTKTDVWSFGILLWEVFSLGHMPYPGCSNEEVMTLVTQGGRLDPPDSCSLAVLSIMIACWSSEIEERPTFSDIISSLEKSLQSSRGLPVIYAPPTISAGGFRLHSGRPSPNSPFLGPGTVLGSSNSVVSDLTGGCGDGLDRLPATAGDGYLAPLLRPQQQQQQQHQQNSRAAPNHRPFSSPGTNQHPGNPIMNSRAKGRLSPSQFSAPTSSASAFHLPSQESGVCNSSGAGGSVFLDCVGYSGAPTPQAPIGKSSKNTRVFYKPGTTSVNNNSDPSSDPASQGLLHGKSQEEKSCSHHPASPSKDSGACEHYGEVNDEEEEDLKQGIVGGGARVALPPLERARSKKVCYTHLPRPSV